MARLSNEQVRELRSRYETEPDGAGDDEVVQACDDLLAWREEAIGFAVEMVEACGSFEDGWHGTNALSHVRGAGEYLVEHAGWERRAGGVGRVQFYRPPTAAMGEPT